MVQALLASESNFGIILQEIGDALDDATWDITIKMVLDGIWSNLKMTSARVLMENERNHTLGKVNPTAFAILIPFVHLPPPIDEPLASTPYSSDGSPKTSQILAT